VRVKVDQMDCTGSGMCELSVPEIFALDAAGLATVRADGLLTGAIVTVDGVAVPAELEDAVRAAAAGCPGACISCHESLWRRAMSGRPLLPLASTRASLKGGDVS